jgi:hypothetical protein
VTGTVFDKDLLGRTLTGRSAPPQPRPLSAFQLQELNTWYELHRSDLRVTFNTQPYAVLSVLLTDAHGQQIRLDLFSGTESWKRAVGVSIWSRNSQNIDGGEMSLPLSDIDTLKAIIGVPTRSLHG